MDHWEVYNAGKCWGKKKRIIGSKDDGLDYRSDGAPLEGLNVRDRKHPGKSLGDINILISTTVNCMPIFHQL